MNDPAFDGVAAGYDERFTEQPVARHLRAEVLAQTLEYLPNTRARILEIGCGTGEDARSFAGQGHVVLATDPSSPMLRIARAKAGDPPAFGTATWAVGTAIPQQILDRAPYDMIFSNFGAVNCFDDLSAFGRDCLDLVRPGGYVAVVGINRWCLMEVLLGALRLDTASMARRFRRSRETKLEDGTSLRVHFPSLRGLASALGAEFTIVSRKPVGVFLPPSEYYTTFQNRAGILRIATAMDQTLGRIWPFSRLGDHQLVVLRRRKDMPE